MDAKMRADFVNSVASGQKVPCPVCNTLNDPKGSFCIACGHPLNSEEKKGESEDVVICPACQKVNKKGFRFCTVCGNKLDGGENVQTVPPKPAGKTMPMQNRPVNKPVNAPVKKKTAFHFAEPEVEEYTEPISVFAQGLPSWNVVPPQIMVRRKKKR